MSAISARVGSALGFAVTIAFLAAKPAEAVPSFARQTGQACTACHVGAFGPQLTTVENSSFTDTWGGGNEKVNDWPLPPLSVYALGSYNRTNKNLPKGDIPAHFDSNDNFALDQASAFYAGTIYGDLGAFIQGTYDGVNHETALDNFARDSTPRRFVIQSSVFSEYLLFAI